jgi:hypothetical protein
MRSQMREGRSKERQLLAAHIDQGDKINEQ